MAVHKDLRLKEVKSVEDNGHKFKESLSNVKVKGAWPDSKLQRNIADSMASWRLRQVDLTSERKTKTRIKEYLLYCQDNERVPSPIGLANWLGVSRETMNAWRSGKFGSTPGERAIEDALLRLEEIWYQDFMDNKQFTGTYAFVGKNWYGYRDVQEMQVTPASPLGEEVSAEELRKRIEQDIVIDAEPIEVRDAEPKVEPNESSEPKEDEPNA